jgi:hypothetical protein
MEIMAISVSEYWICLPCVKQFIEFVTECQTSSQIVLRELLC